MSPALAVEARVPRLSRSSHHARGADRLVEQVRLDVDQACRDEAVRISGMMIRLLAEMAAADQAAGADEAAWRDALVQRLDRALAEGGP